MRLEYEHEFGVNALVVWDESGNIVSKFVNEHEVTPEMQSQAHEIVRAVNCHDELVNCHDELLASCCALLAVVAIQNGNLHAGVNAIQEAAEAADFSPQPKQRRHGCSSYRAGKTKPSPLKAASPWW